MTYPKTTLIIPAYNEEKNIPHLKKILHHAPPNLHTLLIDDGSTDHTAALAKKHHFNTLTHPTNQGIGAALKTGIRHALQTDTQYIIRIDADGQHPPQAIPQLLHILQTQPHIDFVTASRYLGTPNYTATPARRLGTTLLATTLSAICHRKITDPTSGFIAMRRNVAQHYLQQPTTQWPETQTLIQLHRHNYKGTEHPTPFAPRNQGHSTIHGWKSYAYVVHTLWILAKNTPRALSTPLFNPEKASPKTAHAIHFPTTQTHQPNPQADRKHLTRHPAHPSSPSNPHPHPTPSE